MPVLISHIRISAQFVGYGCGRPVARIYHCVGRQCQQFGLYSLDQFVVVAHCEVGAAYAAAKQNIAA